MSEQQMIEADLLVTGAEIITMNGAREVIRDGALATRGDSIVMVGKSAQAARTVRAKKTVDGTGFVISPGFVDGHIHITADPLTRGFVRRMPEDSWGNNLAKWVIPLFKCQTAEDERLAAQLSAATMIRYGTTTFLEAGTVIQMEAVMEALGETGIRGRVGQWVEGRDWGSTGNESAKIDEAIGLLRSEVEAWPDDGDCLLAAWPVLVGHSTNPDEVWLAARHIADERGLKLSAHMSPRQSDPDWFLQSYNRRPLEHLADIGAMGPNVLLTHLAAIDESELQVLAESGAGCIHCPDAAFLGGMGLARQGLHPEMLDRGVTVMLGTDGMASDILSSARRMAAGYRDARGDQDLLPSTSLLELATVNGAKAMGWQDRIGAIAPGFKADFVMHDTRRVEWGPVFDSVGQLALCAPPAGVHHVWINGRQVLDAGRNLLLDEEKLLADAVQAGKALVERTGLPVRTPWPVA
ncbi:amidohydrolase family protein [Aurantiacibacter flavus]|uniref:Amidohydrolase family protein n=1 Tax=Aurantiacibacter flavus TaxID=3145232 RepID=A0ABV0D2J6_9SPHN